MVKKLVDPQVVLLRTIMTIKKIQMGIDAFITILMLTGVEFMTLSILNHPIYVVLVGEGHILEGLKHR